MLLSLLGLGFRISPSGFNEICSDFLEPGANLTWKSSLLIYTYFFCIEATECGLKLREEEEIG